MKKLLPDPCPDDGEPREDAPERREVADDSVPMSLLPEFVAD